MSEWLVGWLPLQSRSCKQRELFYLFMVVLLLDRRSRGSLPQLKQHRVVTGQGAEEEEEEGGRMTKG